MESLATALWRSTDLGGALLAATRTAGLPHQDVALHRPPIAEESSQPKDQQERDVGHWLESAGRRIGVEANAVCSEFPGVRELLNSCAPAILRIKTDELDGWLVIVGRKRGRLRIVRPDLTTILLDTETIERAVQSDVATLHGGVVDALLKDIELSDRRRQSARAALLHERLGKTSIGGCWLLRTPGHREVCWGRWLTFLIGSHLIEHSCWIASWSVLGWMTFSGRLEPGLLVAWAMLLACIIPFRLLSSAAGGFLALEFNASLRRHLLKGTLQLDPDELRSLGTGGFIGRAFEVDALQQLALAGGLQSLLSVVEIVSAFVILGPIAGQWLLALLLLLVVTVVLAQATGYFRSCSRWTAERISLTGQLVERLVGHRTTLAQEPETHGHRAADTAIDRYVHQSRSMDTSIRRLQVLPGRIFLILALLILAPGFVTGQASTTSLAVALGGLLFARQGLQRMLEGVDRVIGAGISWNQLKQFLLAARRPVQVGDPDFEVSHESDQAAIPAGSDQDSPFPSAVLEGRDLIFRHAHRSEPVLRGIDVTVRHRDRILLQGASGGGKSTLAAVLAGSRIQTSGVRLLQGLDQPTLGESWRRRVVLAPQFHDNHVLMGTFLYNLLLGRDWPPTAQDAREAEQICRELDLGPLLDRMPGGLLQMVGETGWQLSHGERSRLFLARALLQKADVMILDECFAALDPVTLTRILPQITRRAPAMIVIAHP